MTSGRGTLVVAAHRGPVQLVAAENGTVEERRGSGGLVKIGRAHV